MFWEDIFKNNYAFKAGILDAVITCLLNTPSASRNYHFTPTEPNNVYCFQIENQAS